MEGLKLIPGFEENGVMEDGSVWSRRRGGVWKRLVATNSTRGYPKVKLGGKLTVDVHVLIALAYLGPRSDGMTIKHKDGDKENSNPSNLEYITLSETNREAWRNGRQRSGWGARRKRLLLLGKEHFGPNGSYPVEQF